MGERFNMNKNYLYVIFFIVFVYPFCLYAQNPKKIGNVIDEIRPKTYPHCIVDSVQKLDSEKMEIVKPLRQRMSGFQISTERKKQYEFLRRWWEMNRARLGTISDHKYTFYYKGFDLDQNDFVDPKKDSASFLSDALLASFYASPIITRSNNLQSIQNAEKIVINKLRGTLGESYAWVLLAEKYHEIGFGADGRRCYLEAIRAGHAGSPAAYKAVSKLLQRGVADPIAEALSNPPLKSRDRP